MGDFSDIFHSIIVNIYLEANLTESIQLVKAWPVGRKMCNEVLRCVTLRRTQRLGELESKWLPQQTEYHIDVTSSDSTLVQRPSCIFLSLSRSLLFRWPPCVKYLCKRIAALRQNKTYHVRNECFRIITVIFTLLIGCFYRLPLIHDQMWQWC